MNDGLRNLVTWFYLAPLCLSFLYFSFLQTANEWLSAKSNHLFLSLRICVFYFYT